MKTPSPNPGSIRAFSLVEVTLVIGLMLILAAISAYSVSSISSWRNGRDASEKLRAVYVAQKSFLADRPAKSVSTFTAAELIPYLPGRPGAMPTQKGNGGETLNLNVQVMPPVYRNGAVVYDPSGSSTDSLWDVGPL